jgi:multiple antibiotic resistance protein
VLTVKPEDSDLALAGRWQNIVALAPFLALTINLSKLQKVKLIALGSLSAFIIMCTRMLTDAAILSFFGISISAFQIAGAFLLGGTGMSMLSASSSADVDGKETVKHQINRSTLISTMIVPVILPLSTGAGTISTVTVFAHLATQSRSDLPLFLAICSMTMIISLIFYFATYLVKFLSEVGMTVLAKVMGLLTLAIGVQFIINGVTAINTPLPGH